MIYIVCYMSMGLITNARAACALTSIHTPAYVCGPTTATSRYIDIELKPVFSGQNVFFFCWYFYHFSDCNSLLINIYYSNIILSTTCDHIFNQSECIRRRKKTRKKYYSKMANNMDHIFSLILLFFFFEGFCNMHICQWIRQEKQDCRYWTQIT